MPPPSRRAVLFLAAAGVLVCGPLMANRVAAATVTVTTTADGGAGSLREAFATASANAEDDVIVLQAGAQYVLSDCAEGDLDHTAGNALTITGNGATIVQTCAGERVIETGGNLTVDATTITGGNLPGGLGGGIEADTSSVVLTGSTVRGNLASTGGGVGAIRVTLTASTVSANTASGAGGGIWADQTLTATNSTISGNQAASGGGVAVVNTSITLNFATVASNTAPAGANVQIQPGGDALVSFGSVVSDPQGGNDCDLAAGSVTTSQGANFSSDATCGFGAGAQDTSAGGDARLGPLAANGGPTQTRLPSSGSPLLDAATCGASPAPQAVDQRGITRPQGSACDIGAVEVEVVVPTTTAVVPTTTAVVPTTTAGPPPTTSVASRGATGALLRFAG